jgi:ribosomal protein L3
MGADKRFVVDNDEIREQIKEWMEHGVYECNYSDFDFKINFHVYDNGKVDLTLVDRTKGFQHHVHRFEFRKTETSHKEEFLEGVKVQGTDYGILNSDKDE